ncbi:MAG: phosphotransferase enzyme family protein [Acidimicrobiia bacterium]
MRGSIDRLAKAALEQYDFSPDAEVTLINVSENSTYRVDDPATGRRAALRVHRPGYHSDAAIESELAWMDALREAGVVKAPTPLESRSGSRVVPVIIEGIPPRRVVLFEWLEGETPTTEGDLVPGFRTLGGIAARMHAHARSWKRPDWFTRHRWDYDGGLGRSANWGRWQSGLGIGAAEFDILTRLDEALRRRLEAYGQAPDRFGLVHTDLRLANLLVQADTISVLDFDDSGFAWFMYDFASALTFIEDDPRVPELQDAWVDGYRRVAPLAPEDEAILPTMMMFRRLILLAWIGSHHEFADEASDLGAGYTTVTCELVERYLANSG